MCVSREWQILMGCRQSVWVEQFAVGPHGAAWQPSGFFSIPRGQARFLVDLRAGHRHRDIAGAVDGIGSGFHTSEPNRFCDREAIDGLDFIPDQGNVQRSPHNFKGEFLDVVDKVGRLFRELICSAYDPHGSFGGALSDSIARLDR